MKRIYYDLISYHLSHLRQMVFLMGPRQVGKTTLALSFLDDSALHYFNWDRSEHRALFLEGPAAIAKQTNVEELKTKPVTLAFDEIHKYNQWKLFLKGFFDSYEKRTKILVTGSARLNIYKRGGDSLMGRYLYYRIHPLSVGEILDPNIYDGMLRKQPKEIPEEDWQALIEHGGFPEPYLQRSKEFSLRLKTIRQEQLIYEDIRDATRIQEIAQLELLTKILKNQAAQAMDYQSLAKKVTVSVDTIRRWLEVLKSFYFCYSIQPWTKNIKRSLLKEPKLYLWDWSQVENLGHRYENMVANHLLKSIHLWNDRGLGHFDLFYLRTKEKREVDFVVTQDGMPWFLVEVKSKDKGLSKELFYFQKMTQAKHAFQISFDLDFVNQDCFKVNDPVIVPAKTFLAQLV